MNTRYYILLIASLFLSACISEFTPDVEVVDDEILVVDGTITDSITTIKLSRSYALNERSAKTNPVGNAVVYVETSGGFTFPASLQTDWGTYKIMVGKLDVDSMYRIRIEWNEEQYFSEFLSPVVSPPIDSIHYRKQGPGAPLEIMVNSEGNEAGSRYYRWTFNETWEYTAELYATGAYDAEKEEYFEYDEKYGPRNPRYYCWQDNHSISLLLENTVQLKENKIIDKKIAEIPSGYKRISHLYFIEVTQYSIGREAYDYFTNLQKNMDDMGSIFAPVPSEMNGNIRCLNKDIPVIGYVEVCIPTRRSIYINREQAQYEKPFKDCDVEATPTLGYGIYLYDKLGGVTHYAPYECIDCTYSGGTNIKPDFWPNDHQLNSQF